MEPLYQEMQALVGRWGAVSDAALAAETPVCTGVSEGMECWEGAVGHPHGPHRLRAKKPEGSVPFRTVSLLLS